MKSLAVDHARDGEVMIAFAMNGQPLPLLNGFPLRLVVPGWYATYWVKMLSDIEVLDRPDTNFWMTTAYTIPDTPNADVKPGQTGVKMVPINSMNPRSFVTNLESGATIPAGKPALARGIAFGGDSGVKQVDFSSDGGKTWHSAALGKDEGKYSFRHWDAFHAGREGQLHAHGPLHQQRWRGATHRGELEPGGVHAEPHRNDASHGGLRRTRQWPV
jgi:hypothetical protein